MNGVFVLVVILVLFCCFCGSTIISGFTGTKSVKSDIDGNSYRVLGSFEGQKEAANTLAMINLFILDLIHRMKYKYLINGEGGNYEKEITQLLLKRYDPKNMFENHPQDLNNTSYVENKGEKIAFCLREKKTGKNNLHTEWDVIKFVVLHEVAHMVTIDYGHDDDFWSNFKFLEHEAKIQGIYNPINFNEKPQEYCAVNITHSPYYSDDIPIGSSL